MKTLIGLLAKRGLKALAALVLVMTLGLVTMKADDFAYMALDNSGFGTIDLDTGVFTSLGNFGQTLAGLGEENGILFGAASGQSAGIFGFLYTINPTNGNLSAVGASGISYDVFGSTTSGLYAVDYDSLNLFSINPATGAATLIGPTGLSLGSWRAISSGGSVLYYADGTNFYTLNPSTGAATLVGKMGGAQLGAMVIEHGILYGGENSPGVLTVTLNPRTGALTDGPVVTSYGGGSFVGLAPDPVTPPPSLTITRAGRSMIISWPTTPGYILQQNSQLNISAGWLNTVYVVTTNSFTKTNSIII